MLLSLNIVFILLGSSVCHPGDKGTCQDKSRNIQGPCRETESGQVLYIFPNKSSGVLKGMQFGSDASG